MNEEQKKWIADLQALINEAREDSPAAYEALVEKVQDHVDASPEP